MNGVLAGALRSGKIAGAYLMEGAAETVAEQADEFLSRLFCGSGTGCGHCPGCAKYRKRIHADLLVVTPGARTIKVDEARAITPFVYRKSFEGGWKAVLIPEAHRMNEPAQNALLKVLEEPPPDTVFVLGAGNIKNLLPTIVSRCIILRMPGSSGQAYRTLMEEFALPAAEARVLLAVAEGDYHRARRYAQLGYFDMRADMMLMLGRVFAAGSMAVSATEKLVTKHGEGMNDALNVALLYIRDVIAYRHTRSGELVANEDVLGEIQKHALVSDRLLVNTAGRIARYLRDCEVCPNLNRKLALSGMLFDLLEVRLTEAGDCPAAQE
jgi:DNA polymerase-3 subunit delta'